MKAEREGKEKARLKAKPETVIKKIDDCLEAMERLSGYLRAKEHNQDILSIRDISQAYGKLFDARNEYKSQLKQPSTPYIEGKKKEI